MDVYVESNFVLEVALLQEQHESCEKIIALCESGKTQLILPAYSFIEPYETIFRRVKKRRKVSNDLGDIVKQLSRSKPYQEEMDALKEKATSFLIRSEEEEKDRLQDTIDKLLQVSQVIPLDSQILLSANKYKIEHDLSPQDSIVYASVLSHLSRSSSSLKCFLNRNSKDFDDPDIEDTLKNYDCKMLFSFDDGYGYITNQLDS
jgi:predicted nucleic acid-binding protein